MYAFRLLGVVELSCLGWGGNGEVGRFVVFVGALMGVGRVCWLRGGRLLELGNMMLFRIGIYIQCLLRGRSLK